MAQQKTNLGVPPNSFDRPGELYKESLAQFDLQKKSPLAIPEEVDVLEPVVVGGGSNSGGSGGNSSSSSSKNPANSNKEPTNPKI